jgi:hypothetical protein
VLGIVMDAAFPWDRKADPHRERCRDCGHNIRCHPTVIGRLGGQATCDPSYPGNDDATCPCPLFHEPHEASE